MSLCFNDLHDRIRVSLFKFAINTKVEATVNILENKVELQIILVNWKDYLRKENGVLIQ